MPSPLKISDQEAIVRFLLILGKKALIIAGAWVVVYFCTQWTNAGPAMLFSLVIGSAAGVAIGWYVAEDAVENAGFGGITLFILLTLAAWIPIWLVEWILGLIMSRVAGWHLEFGRYMLLTSAMLLGFASAVYRASADD